MLIQLAGCAGLVSSATGRMADDLSAAILKQDDPETVAAGMPSYLLMADGLIDITATEFDILDLLVRAEGRVVTRDEVCGMLYQRKATPFERALEVHISRLRKKNEGAGLVIRSIRGVGYRFSVEPET